MTTHAHPSRSRRVSDHSHRVAVVREGPRPADALSGWAWCADATDSPVRRPPRPFPGVAGAGVPSGERKLGADGRAVPGVAVDLEPPAERLDPVGQAAQA